MQSISTTRPVFCLLAMALSFAIISLSGCAAHNPNGLFNSQVQSTAPVDRFDDEGNYRAPPESAKNKKPRGFWHQRFGDPAGFDPVARDIERRLGVGEY